MCVLLVQSSNGTDTVFSVRWSEFGSRETTFFWLLWRQTRRHTKQACWMVGGRRESKSKQEWDGMTRYIVGAYLGT